MKKIVFTITLILLIAGCVEQNKNQPHSKFYAGDYRNFRANIFEARETTIYPNEDVVRNILLNPEVSKVHISYISNKSEDQFYFVSTFEITNKLTIIYRHLFQGARDIDFYQAEDGSTCIAFFSRKLTGALMQKCFKSTPLNTTDQAFELASETEPVIFLSGPSQSNVTRVVIDGYVIKAEAASFSEVNRTFTDLDLSVAQILLSLMEV